MRRGFWTEQGFTPYISLGKFENIFLWDNFQSAEQFDENL